MHPWKPKLFFRHQLKNSLTERDLPVRIVGLHCCTSAKTRMMMRPSFRLPFPYTFHPPEIFLCFCHELFRTYTSWVNCRTQLLVYKHHTILYVIDTFWICNLFLKLLDKFNVVWQLLYTTLVQMTYKKKNIKL